MKNKTEDIHQFNGISLKQLKLINVKNDKWHKQSFLIIDSNDLKMDR